MRAIVLASLMALAAAVANSAPSRPAAANHVGLICKGTQKTFKRDGVTEEPWERTFSMDFDASKGWVVGAQGQFDIAATETRITFWDGGYEIDRNTGQLTGHDDNKYLPFRVSAACEKTTYTPIPAKKF